MRADGGLRARLSGRAARCSRAPWSRGLLLYLAVAATACGPAAPAAPPSPEASATEVPTPAVNPTLAALSAEVERLREAATASAVAPPTPTAEAAPTAEPAPTAVTFEDAVALIKRYTVLVVTERGSVLNVYKGMANHPEALRALFELTTATYRSGSLEPRHRELAYLYTSTLNQCHY